MDKLPREMVTHICSFLAHPRSIPSLLNFRISHKRAYNITNDKNIWKQVIQVIAEMYGFQMSSIFAKEAVLVWYNKNRPLCCECGIPGSNSFKNANFLYFIIPEHGENNFKCPNCVKLENLKKESLRRLSAQSKELIGTKPIVPPTIIADQKQIDKKQSEPNHPNQKITDNSHQNQSQSKQDIKELPPVKLRQIKTRPKFTKQEKSLFNNKERLILRKFDVIETIPDHINFKFK